MTFDKWWDEACDKRHIPAYTGQQYDSEVALAKVAFDAGYKYGMLEALTIVKETFHENRDIL